jgi:hypothetical protein
VHSEGTLLYNNKLAVEYKDFDVFVPDVNEHKLAALGVANGVENMGEGSFSDPAFPALGTIYGTYMRYMVPLVVQRAGKPSSNAVNVWFLVDSGTSFTCLTTKTLETLFGTGKVVDAEVVERIRCKSCGKPIDDEKSSVDNRSYFMAIQVCF